MPVTGQYGRALGVRPIFSREAETSLPEKYFDSTRKKSTHLTWANTKNWNCLHCR